MQGRRSTSLRGKRKQEQKVVLLVFDRIQDGSNIYSLSSRNNICIYIFIRLFHISNSIYSYNSVEDDYLQYNLTSIIYLNRVYIFQLFFPRDGSRGISFKKRRQRVSIFHHQRSISRRINPHQNRLYLLSFSSSRHESRGVVT